MFHFNWPHLSDDEIVNLKGNINEHLEKLAVKSPLASPLRVSDLSLGQTPPKVAIVSICEVSADTTSTLFDIQYGGEGFVTIRVDVQINLTSPTVQPNSSKIINGHLGLLVCHRPLVFPLSIKLSNFRIEGTLHVEFNVEKGGVKFFFVEDPLIGFTVETTLDNLYGAHTAIQETLELQIHSAITFISPFIAPVFFQTSSTSSSSSSSSNISTDVHK